MSRPVALTLAVSALAGCSTAPMLQLDVVNESQSDAIIEVLGPSGADAGYRAVVSPGGGYELAVGRQAQTWRATRATSSSFARWSSTETRFPGIVEAKPHCGLSASRSSGT